MSHSQILALEDGVTVVTTDYKSDGWCRGIIIHSTNDFYRVGSNDISISQSQIEKATVLTFTDDVVAGLIEAGEVHGPHKTVSDLFINRPALSV